MKHKLLPKLFKSFQAEGGGGGGGGCGIHQTRKNVFFCRNFFIADTTYRKILVQNKFRTRNWKIFQEITKKK